VLFQCGIYSGGGEPGSGNIVAEPEDAGNHNALREENFRGFKERCSIFTALPQSQTCITTGIHLLTTLSSDMYRPPLPTAHPSRLPTHLLWCLPERMVCLPGLDCDLYPPVHMPVMPRVGAYHSTQCDRHHPPRDVHKGESGERQERAGEEG
jgi:hypothetical protein